MPPQLAVEQALQEAIAHHLAQRWPEAERLYRTILEAEPHHPDAHHNLGVLMVQGGRPEEALEHLRTALQRQPAQGQYWLSLIETLMLLGREREAADLLAQGRERGLSGPSVEALVRRLADPHSPLSPTDPPASPTPPPPPPTTQANPGPPLAEGLAVAQPHLLAGDPLSAEGDHAEVSQRDPHDFSAHHALGVLSLQTGRPQRAIGHLERALLIRPHVAETLYLLGLALQESGHGEEAVSRYEQALEIRPEYQEAWNNLGNVLQEQGNPDRAVVCYERALALRGDDPDTLNNLAALLARQGKLEAAAGRLGHALRVRPDFPEGWANLGNVLKELGKLDDSAACYERALQFQPESLMALNNLGTILLWQGRVAEAETAFRRALAAQPNHWNCRRNLLNTLYYLPSIPDQARFDENVTFGTFASPRGEITPPSPSSPPDEHRRLRIGYLSSDFRDHPVGRNLMPVLERTDLGHFQVHCYSDVARPDAATERFQKLADHWRDITGMSDEAVARLIRQDRIHILVILAGRFDRNRPTVCAHRAAPVQISWYDAATSGFREMDHLLSDRFMTPRHGTERFTERVIRLPSTFVYGPIPGAPEPAPTPLLSREDGLVSFGSFNNPAKLNDQVLELWARLLSTIPDSQLFLGYKNHFDSRILRDRVRSAMESQGVAMERIRFLPQAASFPEQLGRYAMVDVALDPFPFCGATTTFEALWMGVPVVTWPQSHMMSRWSASLLHQCRLPHLIAASPGEYIAICRDLISDPRQLQALRASVRQRLLEAPCCDAARMTRHLERVFRALWRRWCRSRSTPGDNS